MLNLRRKMAEGKLEDYEKDFVRKNQELVCILSPEEEADLKELNDFLDTIT